MRRALAFLTPIGKGVEPDGRTLNWFPLVGAIIGGVVGVLWWAAGKAWAPIVAGAVAVVVDVVATGGLHLDGLADTADGLVPPMEKSRRLEVMRDPAVGAFGAMALITVLLLRVAAFASTTARPLVVAGLWCGSRTAMALAVRSLPYAQPEGGLASAFGATAPGSQRRLPRRTPGTGAVVSIVAAVALALGLAILGGGIHGLAAVGGEALGVAAVLWLGLRRIGGFTGDVLGAAGVVGETVGLLVLAVR
jgi:adenosylcobinamide-GDP ribazoletransferase